MNHKWENDKCLKCGIIRAEIKSLDEKEQDILMYQYSDNSGKSWVIKRPDCKSQIPEIKPFSIKDTLYQIKSNPVDPYPKKVELFDYSELLKHPKWQRKRLEIMQRDNFKCCLCLDEETTLNVHHKQYMNGKKPWEYEDDNFMTLCEDCHSLVEDYKRYPDHYINSEYPDILNSKILKIKPVGEFNDVHLFISVNNDLFLY
jgi:hypothetical protein